MSDVLPSFSRPILPEPADNAASLLAGDEIRLLAALGFSAVRMGQLESCIRIFEALALLRPGQAFPFIGMALGYLAVGRPHAAVELLVGRASCSCSDAPDIKLYLSLALQHAGSGSQAVRMLRAWEEESGQRAVGHPLARTIAVDEGVTFRSLGWPAPAAIDAQAP